MDLNLTNCTIQLHPLLNCPIPIPIPIPTLDSYKRVTKFKKYQSILSTYKSKHNTYQIHTSILIQLPKNNENIFYIFKTNEWNDIWSWISKKLSITKLTISQTNKVLKKKYHSQSSLLLTKVNMTLTRVTLLSWSTLLS